MLYGLYLSAQGAEVQAFRQAVLANNTANVDTPAFKPDFTVFRAHLPHDAVHPPEGTSPPALELQTGGISLEGTVTNFEQGVLATTGAPLDVGLEGPGFLQVRDGESTWLTRNGRMSINAAGQLTTPEGHLVLSADGSPLELPADTAQLQVSLEGQVTSIDSSGLATLIGALSVVEPAPEATLTKQGRSFYAVAGEVTPSEMTQVRQGTLERSGSDPVAGTVELIEMGRAFEMNMNLMQMQDESLGKLLQFMPRR